MSFAAWLGWTVSAVLASAFSSAAPAHARQELESAVPDDSREETPVAPVVLAGVVLERGALVEGALVTSSAGGRALTDARGRYVLDVLVPLDAESVQVTAVGRDGGVASALARVSAARSAFVDPLPLARGLGCAPEWLPTFGGRPGTDFDVRALAVFDDGSGPALYAAGVFTVAGGVPASRIARWDGASWSTLGSGMNNVVHALAVFDDGGGPALYAGGLFTSAGGVAANRVARWDGSAWSALGAGTGAAVLALAVHDDGGGPALYAGGRFTSAGGAPASRVARWDGSAWSALGAGTGGDVHSLAAFDAGAGEELYAGGEFTTAGGSPASFVARWDRAGWSALGAGVSGTTGFEAVYSLVVHDDGGGAALYAGGQFTKAGGATALYVARWDGASWSSLDGGTNSHVRALAVFEGELHATGGFTSAGGDPAQFVARWDGAGWNPLGAGIDQKFPSVTPLSLCEFDDGDGAALFVGGDFLGAGGVPASHVARWDGAWDSLGHGVSAPVYALAEHDDGSGPALFAGGSLGSAGGAQLGGVGRFDGASWSGLDGGVSGAFFDNSVYALAEFDDGGGSELYAGGHFWEAGGNPSAHLARWDGAGWSALGAGIAGPSDERVVAALLAHDDGSGPALYVAGHLTSAGGNLANRIARWNGGAWLGVGGGTNHPILALAQFDDGGGPALYAGGQFTSAGGSPANRIARWDGAAWSALGAGLSGWVHALAVFDDGSGDALYAGGTFTSAGGSPASRVARWDGVAWSALGAGVNDDVYALAVHDDGTGPALFAAGEFTTAGGVAATRVARWDGASWSAVGGGANAAVHVLLSRHDGDEPALYAGGEFLTAFDAQDSFLARWRCAPDTTPPTLFLPAPVTTRDHPGGAPGAVVLFTVTATDDRDASPSVVCVPPSGSVFPVGTTLVTCTATDDVGNESVGSFSVTVRPAFRERQE